MECAPCRFRGFAENLLRDTQLRKLNQFFLRKAFELANGLQTLGDEIAEINIVLGLVTAGAGDHLFISLAGLSWCSL